MKKRLMKFIQYAHALLTNERVNSSYVKVDK